MTSQRPARLAQEQGQDAEGVDERDLSGDRSASQGAGGQVYWSDKTAIRLDLLRQGFRRCLCCIANCTEHPYMQKICRIEILWLSDLIVAPVRSLTRIDLNLTGNCKNLLASFELTYEII